MKIGIVGHEAAKFTSDMEYRAKLVIAEILIDRGLLIRPAADFVIVSGHCHLGGVDIWAEEIGQKNGCTLDIKKPTRLTWSGAGGFMDRNLKIANDSDEVHIIVVTELPPTYTGMRFPMCYHCKTATHVKSGGCWTGLQAQRRGKPAIWHEITPTSMA